MGGDGVVYLGRTRHGNLLGRVEYFGEHIGLLTLWSSTPQWLGNTENYYLLKAQSKNWGLTGFQCRYTRAVLGEKKIAG